MENKIERPSSLTPRLGEIFGNEQSHKLVQACFDEAFAQYQRTQADCWDDNTSMRDAYSTALGSMESKIHYLCERLAISEAYEKKLQKLIYGESASDEQS